MEDKLGQQHWELSSVKQALLEKRLRREVKYRTSSLPLHKRPAEFQEIAPTSFAQQRLWFLDQLEPGSLNYHLFHILRLYGALNLTALKCSLNEIVRRHEILRTTFVASNGTPAQHIHAAFSLDPPLVDLSSFPEQERQRQVDQLLKEASQQPFDLQTGPLLRTQIVRLEEEEHLFVLVFHHIITDAWSMGILNQELTHLYAAYCGSQPSPLPDPPVQYADYAVWQHKWLQEEQAKQQRAYWEQQLAGAPPTLSLPADHPRPPIQSFRGKTLPFWLPSTTLEALRRFSRSEEVTLFMLLLTIFQILLARYTGQEDIVVGSPIANRTCAETESLIGFLVNTLVLRTDLAGNPTFREVLQRVRNMTLEAYDHQDFPFDQLVGLFQLERNLSYNPLFQAMFSLENTPQAPAELQDLRLQSANPTNTAAKFDLSAMFHEEPGGLRGEFEYSVDLFERTTVERLIKHYQTLLEGALKEPDQCIWDLPLLTEQEQRQILVDWNATQQEYAQARLVHQLVEEQEEKRPGAIALCYEEQQLTYQELNQRSNRLARHLRCLGVGSEDLVGICMERSPEMVISALAVLKAGGAYVPLDPAYPQDRLAFILADARVKVLLTQQHIAEHLAAQVPHALCLDDAEILLASYSDANLVNLSEPENLAYVIYTSGSTGRPKGVAVTHANLLSFVFWHSRTYALTAQDRCTQLASFGFDASVLELWPTLIAGARLYLADEETRLSPPKLRDWLLVNQITVSFTPTPMAEELLQLSWAPQASLRFLLTGGDKLQRFPASDLSFVLINHYGPTECTIVATATPVPSRLESERPPSIGFPIANTQACVLDCHFQPVPIGVAGNLYLGGTRVARGYLNRPDLTAERFLPDPWSTEPGARLYETGDVVRYLPNGEIEFLDRSDHQVKLRGFRIELGEIETILRAHEDIRDALVLLHKGERRDKCLVAYLVPVQQPGPTSTQIRSYLREHLPDYMIPVAFVPLPEFPLTVNGKLDRKALPAPDQMRSEHDYVAPRTSLEKVLAGMWGDLLEVEQIGIHDNFFALGGHSLLATRFISQVLELLQMEISLRTFFECPTLALLAGALCQEESQHERLEETAQILLSVSHLSDEEVSDLLSKMHES